MLLMSIYTDGGVLFCTVPRSNTTGVQRCSIIARNVVLQQTINMKVAYWWTTAWLKFYSEQSYLSIYWTNFHDFFTKWKIFAWIFSIQSSFSDSSTNVAMATNFVSQAKHKPCAISAISTQYESVLGVDDRSDFFFNISRDVAMAANILAKLYIPLHVSIWHSEME